MLSVDINTVINMVNILVLYLLMKKFLFGPVTEIMEKRKNVIANSFAQAEAKNQEALKLKEEYGRALGDAKETASNIVKEGMERALLEGEKQRRETQEEVAKMKEEAYKAIELERIKSKEELQSEIAGIALVAAAKVIQENVDDERNRQIVTEFLQEAGATK